MAKSLGYHGAIETRLHFQDGEMIAEDVLHGRYVQSILDQNQRDRSLGHNPKAMGRHAARVPLPLLETWRQEWRANHADKWEWSTYLAMKLNSRDYSHLRTGVNRL